MTEAQFSFTVWVSKEKGWWPHHHGKWKLGEKSKRNGISSQSKETAETRAAAGLCRQMDTSLGLL